MTPSLYALNNPYPSYGYASDDTIAESIIGTRWIAAGKILVTRDTIEFIDKTYCIYTSLKRSMLFIYKVKKSRIIIYDIGSFIIKGNTLFLGKSPYFTCEE